MRRLIRTADSKGRVTLPGFANATLLIEQVNDTEYRVRKVQSIPEEDFPVALSTRDAAAFVKSLETLPAPNQVARRAARKFMKDFGGKNR